MFWTANVERYSDIIQGVNDTTNKLLVPIASSHSEVSRSTQFAVAAILEGEPFVKRTTEHLFLVSSILPIVNLTVDIAHRLKAFLFLFLGVPYLR
jgi:myo-inositol-1-phosphate synthase